MKNKNRIGLVVAVGLLGLLLLLIGRPSRSPVTPAPEAEEQGAPSPAQPIARRLAGPTPVALPTAPVVEAVDVEKTEVCSGEDNLVTVRLASGYVNDPNIRIMMVGMGAAGPQMPFNLTFTGNKQQPEMPEVTVFSHDGILTTVKIPTVTVKDCTPGPSLVVQASLMANTSATYGFTATIRNSGPTPFKPVEWRWNFGDGTDTTTNTRGVEHSYEDRPQRTRISAFLIDVRAVDAQGEEIVGRSGLEVRNRAFEALNIKHVILLSTELNPRFPEMGADGRVTERVRIHHAYDKPVTIQRVFMQRFRHNREGREQVEETEIDPSQILGTNVIPPGSGIEATAMLDTRAEMETGLLTFDLRGTTPDGLRASGQFSVMRPPELIPKEQREIVTNPRLKAEILATRTILGRDRVTEDDIVKLRREGALDGLAVTEDGQATAAGGEEQAGPHPPALPPKAPRGGGSAISPHAPGH